MAGYEFSRQVSVDAVTREGYEIVVEATPAERDALAKRFGLRELQKLAATLTFTRGRAGTIEMNGHINASVTQGCVVTLEPVHSSINADFHQLYAEAPETLTNVNPDDLDAEPEPIFAHSMEVGEVVAQNLSLNLNPYPRLANARVDPRYLIADEPEPHTPLSGLSGLIPKPKT